RACKQTALIILPVSLVIFAGCLLKLSKIHTCSTQTPSLITKSCFLSIRYSCWIHWTLSFRSEFDHSIGLIVGGPALGRMVPFLQHTPTMQWLTGLTLPPSCLSFLQKRQFGRRGLYWSRALGLKLLRPNPGIGLARSCDSLTLMLPSWITLLASVIESGSCDWFAK